jgi:UDP-glucose 4-epimerase
MSKRILVTGGAGFIGSHLVSAILQRGDTPVVFDNESTGTRKNLSPDVEFILGDIRDSAALEKAFDKPIDVVMHLAGQASIKLSFADPSADLNINTVGTINILQHCIKHNVPRLIFASSMTVYGTPVETPTPETCLIVPTSYYGVTKYAAERYVHLTAQRTDLPGPLNVTSFRMFNVYGERQSLTNAYQGVLAIFLGRLLRGEPIVIHSDGEQSRDFVYVGDVARAWLDAIDSELSYGEVINIGTGHATSVNALCDAALQAFGHTRATYPVHYQSAQLGDIRVSYADIRKARELLNWTPEVKLTVGMQKTVDWVNSQL